MRPSLENLLRIQKLTRCILLELVPSSLMTPYLEAVTSFFHTVRGRLAKEAHGRNPNKSNPVSDNA